MRRRLKFERRTWRPGIKSMKYASVKIEPREDGVRSRAYEEPIFEI